MRDARANESTEAVVLRIDSSGGAAQSSEEFYLAVDRTDVAEGDTYLGPAAVENGFADRTGDLDAASERAAALSGDVEGDVVSVDRGADDGERLLTRLSASRPLPAGPAGGSYRTRLSRARRAAMALGAVVRHRTARRVDRTSNRSAERSGYDGREAEPAPRSTVIRAVSRN